MNKVGNRFLKFKTIFKFFIVLVAFVLFLNHAQSAHAATIRQEIHIGIGSAGNTNLGLTEKVQLDTTQYNGSATYYFEGVCAYSSAGTVQLYRSDAVTIDATLTWTSGETAYSRKRVAFTPPAGNTVYFVYKGGSSTFANCKTTRIIVIQTASPITSTETQIEVGGRTGYGVNYTYLTTPGPLTDPKYWLYTAANWDGTKTFYAEVTFVVSSTQTATVTLQEDDGSFANWTDKVTIVNALQSNTIATWKRSVSFAPTDGRHYRIAGFESTANGGKYFSIFNAKIIVDQVSTVGTAYYFNTSDAGPTDPNSNWTNDANAFDGSTSTNALQNLATTSTTSSNYLQGDGTNTPTTGASILSVRARMYAGGDGTVTSGITGNAAIYTSGLGELLGTVIATIGTPGVYQWSAYIELSTPTGGWTWQKLNDLATKLYGSTGSGQSISVFRVEIDVNPTNPSLLEPQYLLLNTTDTGSTGLQLYQQQWNASEWSGVSNVYKYAQDATNAADSSSLQDIDNGNSDITTGTQIPTGANQQIGTAFTMPTDTHQFDVNVTNTTGAVGAGRVLVATTIQTYGPLDHYLVTVATPQTAGVCSTGTNSVTAQDASNVTVANDTSTVNMTSSGTGITFYTAGDCSSSTTQYTLSSGVSNIYYKTNIAQSFTITATKASSTETGTSSSITVNPGSQTRLVVTLPSQSFTAGTGNSGSVDNQTANTQFTITSIIATDDYFNIITGYSGAKTLSYSGPTGSPTYTTSVNFTSGASTTTLLTTLTAAETTTITVTDGGQYGYASSSLTVNASGGIVPKSIINGGTTIRGGTRL